GRRLTSAPVSDQYADWLVDAQGEVAATLYFTTTNDKWRIVNARNREIAAGHTPKGGAKVLGFGTESDKIVYSVSPERGPPRFFEVALDGGAEPQELWAGKEIDAVFLDRHSSRLIGYQPDTLDDDVDPEFFDPTIQAKVTKVTSAFRPLGGVMHDWTPDFGRILVNTAGSNDSGTWFVIDTVAGRSTVVGKSRPQIEPHQVGPISMIHYKAQDGLEIEAVLTLPPGREAKGLPLVMLPHGGPRAHDDETFDWWAQAFASRGYAVLQPNFRGSTEHGEEFLHAGDGEWGKKMQTDLSDGMAYLAEQGMIDPA